MTAQARTRNRTKVPATIIGFITALALATPSASTAPREATELQGDAAVGPDAAAPARTSAAAASSGSFSDVPAGHWARTAIEKVAADRAWMRDFGTSTFKPGVVENRKLFARAVVRAFAPTERTDPSIRFTDMAPSDPHFPYANVAVKLGWMSAKRDGRFRPTEPVTIISVHRALVRALGLGAVADGANAIHDFDGTALKHRWGFGPLLLGRVLGLRYNHPTESMEITPREPLPRSEVAWSLYRAYVVDTSETWRKTSVQIYRNIRLGELTPEMRRVVEFGLRYVGWPYYYAGEWAKPTPSRYCCGGQEAGGFDCSGLMWWVLRQGDSMYSNVGIRGYRGWPLGQRSSHDMAMAISSSQRVWRDDLRPGDLMFYDSNRDGRMDHVNMYLGWGWALDSGSNGATLVRVSPDSWYGDYFKWGRRIVTG
jgi:hypothetical protein